MQLELLLPLQITKTLSDLSLDVLFINLDAATFFAGILALNGLMVVLLTAITLLDSPSHYLGYCMH